MAQGSQDHAVEHATATKYDGPGNYQPTRSFGPSETGGQVQGALARYDNDNIQDGVGDGVDQYIMYTGNGDNFPQRSQWVSFENMYVFPCFP